MYETYLCRSRPSSDRKLSFLAGMRQNMLVDCGMQQGSNPFECCEMPVDEAQIDYVFLTHAHVDHSGNLPLLYARGFRGQVFTTEASSGLCSIMLRDCAHIQIQEAEWKTERQNGIPD